MASRLAIAPSGGCGQLLPLSTALRCRNASPFRSNRFSPNGVSSASSLVPGEAGPVVTRVALSLAVPWQSMQSISRAGLGSLYSLPLPWLSCWKWQSTQCIPFSRWMSFRWTAFWNLSGALSGTTLPAASSRLPLRSRL